jgi:pilus assembly protein CpaB
MLTRRVDGRNDLVTDVILQDIVVRAIDQTSDEQREKPQVAKTVTVEVDPEEAQKLALAMQVGTLTLALRNIRSAEEAAEARTVRVHDLVEREVRQVQPSVRVRRGAGAMAIETVR